MNNGNFDNTRFWEHGETKISGAEKRIPPNSISPFPDIDGFAVENGEEHYLVTIVQLMLEILKLYYDTFGDLPVSGILDEDTDVAVREFQRINGIDVTGVIDRETWDALAEEFNAALWENQ